MRFLIDENRTHWKFGHSYNARLLQEPTIKEELTMLEWLEGKKYTWYSHDTICFKNEHDRTLFVMRFS
jgi:hypothetical protein